MQLKRSILIPPHMYGFLTSVPSGFWSLIVSVTIYWLLLLREMSWFYNYNVLMVHILETLSYKSHRQVEMRKSTVYSIEHQDYKTYNLL